MKLIVTGGAGFMGANFIFHMLARYPSYRIICLDKLTYAGHLSTLAQAMDNPQFRFVQGDICETRMLEQLFVQEAPDVVVNFAAESHVDRSIAAPSVFVRSNILGTAALLEVCHKYGIQRYHQISTDEVYGELPLDRPDLLFTEAAPLHGSSPYSSSKAAADLLVLAWHRTYGLPVSISRCVNNYGPYQLPEKLLPLMLIRALQGETLPVFGDGLNMRDWLYVADHSEAVDLIIHHGRPGEVYNIAAQQAMRNIELVRLLCREVGVAEALIQHVADRPGHDRRYALDSSKIQRELGWHARTDFLTGFRQTVQWYLENRGWWAELVAQARQVHFRGRA